jgi:uroporphyrinogen-III synthase
LLSAELEKFGAEVIEIPTIAIVPPTSFEALDAALRNLRRFQWLVVTSVNTVRALQERCSALGIVPSDFAALKIAAVGAATTRALESAGLSVAVAPTEYVAESLLEALGDRTDGCEVLIARVAVARDLIPEALARRGARVTVVEAYQTIIPVESVAKISRLFDGEVPDAATFASSITVSNFFHLIEKTGLKRPAAMLAFSIGPITSRTLREHGWEPAAEAAPHDVHGLAAAVVRGLGAN